MSYETLTQALANATSSSNMKLLQRYCLRGDGRAAAGRAAYVEAAAGERVGEAPFFGAMDHVVVSGMFTGVVYLLVR